MAKKVTQTTATDLLAELDEVLGDLVDSAALAKRFLHAPQVTPPMRDAGVALAEHILERLDEAHARANAWRDRPVKVVEYDCLQCSACCVPNNADKLEHGYHVHVTKDDLERLTPEERASLIVFDGESFTRTKTNGQGLPVCQFLEGNVGYTSSCSIYERRPQGCRDLQNGRCSCRSYRQKSSLNVIGDCDC